MNSLFSDKDLTGGRFIDPCDHIHQCGFSALTNHITGTLINLLKWWVNSKMSYTPQQMDRYFQELVNPCINSVIYGSKLDD